MLIKEYRICLPMSVEEYRIAQLYMIQKKSRLESKGEGSRVEIVTNEPYTEGPGGTSGQHTLKLYHIEQHIPGWFRVLLSDSSCTVEEEAWNAYPYTCTKYTCPFIKHFTLEIETIYRPDAGQEHNVFNLSAAELSNRTVDVVDIVKDSLPGADYTPDEDPRLYKSLKNGRGPLMPNWLQDYQGPLKGGTGLPGKPIMCSYKLCRVNFPYWGFQGKIERFIHDIGLRKTILRAHRQAWCWQDEYHGLTMDDIRRLEKETQLALQSNHDPLEHDQNDKVSTSGTTEMHDGEEANAIVTQGGVVIIPELACIVSASPVNHLSVGVVSDKQQISGDMELANSNSNHVISSQSHDTTDSAKYISPRLHINSVTSTGSGASVTSMTSLNSMTPTNSMNRMASLTSGRRTSRAQRLSLASIRNLEPMIELLQTVSMSEDDNEEFFDACDELPDDNDTNRSAENLSSLSSSLSSLAECRIQTDVTATITSTTNATIATTVTAASLAAAELSSASDTNVKLCSTDILLLVIHGGTTVDTSQSDQLQLKQADLMTFQSTFNSVLRSLYPSALSKVALRLVACPNISSEALYLLARLNPDGYVADPGATSTTVGDIDSLIHPDLLHGTLPLLISASPVYDRALEEVTIRANAIYKEFICSEVGRGFCGQVYMIGDGLGSLMAYDILCSRHAMRSVDNQLDLLSLYDESEPAVSDTRGFLTSHSGSTVQRASSCRAANDRASSIHSAANHKASCFRAASERARSLKFKNTRSKNQNPDSRSTDSNQGSVGHIHSKDENSKSISENKSSTSFQSANGLSASAENLTIGGSGLGTTNTSERGGDILSSSESTSRLFQADESVRVTREPVWSDARQPFVVECGREEMVAGQHQTCLEFGVSEMFMLGSPIGLVLAHRKIPGAADLVRPACRQIYNLYYTSSPTAVRVEPLLHPAFSHFSAVPIPKYSSKYSHVDNHSNSLADTVIKHREVLTLHQPPQVVPGEAEGRTSHTDYGSALDDTDIESLYTKLEESWWGDKRLDYSLYCPVSLIDLPPSTLSHVLHAGFWESNDAVAFILRQILNQDIVSYRGSIVSETQRLGNSLAQLIGSGQPAENWLKKRTFIKVKNLSPNHRANDVLVAVDQPQILTARFMYGPLDMVCLSGEKVDVYVVDEKQQQSKTACSKLLGTVVTDSTGRAVYEVSKDRLLPEGIHHVCMVVRGDHSSAEFKLSVLPPRTETVVFSIDGSFAASVSLTGTDPKVRPGAVDVVRHWSELDYLVLYVSARPDVQQRKVVEWMAQHRFPRGMIAFIDRLTTDPLKQKANYLKQLVSEAQIRVHAAYGSPKDLAVYQCINLPSSRTFIVGKLSRKLRGLAVELTEGYPSHLNDLNTSALTRQAVISLRLAPRSLGCFTTSVKEIKTRAPVKKTNSLPSDGFQPALNGGSRKERAKNTDQLVTSGEYDINDSNRSDSITANCCENFIGGSSCRNCVDRKGASSCAGSDAAKTKVSKSGCSKK